MPFPHLSEGGDCFLALRFPCGCNTHTICGISQAGPLPYLEPQCIRLCWIGALGETPMGLKRGKPENTEDLISV